MEPRLFTICGVQERDTIFALPGDVDSDCTGVPLSLWEDSLGSSGLLLGFYDSSHRVFVA
ncbi:Uncharacterised protein [Mycobacteroides abscessus subsp. abscessus]|nr:hypothetical protein MM1S1510930_2483 [Mycobacteroides abscessus subsp. bolletii 1S-151-0930]SHW33477.1 Uncharacterised protein [Mycobacteroides abscessus subsp. abscessus]